MRCIEQRQDAAGVASHTCQALSERSLLARDEKNFLLIHTNSDLEMTKSHANLRPPQAWPQRLYSCTPAHKMSIFGQQFWLTAFCSLQRALESPTNSIFDFYHWSSLLECSPLICLPFRTRYDGNEVKQVQFLLLTTSQPCFGAWHLPLLLSGAFYQIIR